MSLLLKCPPGKLPKAVSAEGVEMGREKAAEKAETPASASPDALSAIESIPRPSNAEPDFSPPPPPDGNAGCNGCKGWIAP